MGVEGHDECAAVDEVSPQAEVDGRAAAHHPPQEHAEPFACRLGVARHHDADATCAEVGTDGLDGLEACVCVMGNVAAQRSVVAQQTTVDGQEVVHLANSEEAVVAVAVACLQRLGEGSGGYPLMDIALRTVEEPLYFGHKLLAAAIAETGGKESHGLLIDCAADLVHEP